MHARFENKIRSFLLEKATRPLLPVFLCAVLLILVYAVSSLAFDYGQTGGGGIAGTLTVTVVDGLDGSPVADAWVMVGSEANDPFAGNFGQTNPSGQIVFTDGALSGAQTVTSIKDGYRAITLVDVNAAELTLPLEFFEDLSPGSLPADQGTIVQGNLTNFTFTNNNSHLYVGIVREAMDLEGLMDFDIGQLFGTAANMTITYPGKEGTYQMPRNVYIPTQYEDPGLLYPFERTPYQSRLLEGDTEQLFCLKGVVGLVDLLSVLQSGSTGSLLGAMTYQQFGLTSPFTVPLSGPMTQNMNLDFTHDSNYGMYLNVQDLPPRPYSWPSGWDRRAFLLYLADLSGGDGSGSIALTNLLIGILGWTGGNVWMPVPIKGGLLAGSSYLGMSAVTAFDSGGNPSFRLGMSGCIDRVPVTPNYWWLGPGISQLNDFYPFVNIMDYDRLDDRIMQFYWAWETAQTGVDYTRCDLDLVATKPCDLLVEDCPVGGQKEYRSSNWTVLLPESRLGFQLPALPPGAPRGLAVPEEAGGVTYTLDWQLSQYGLFHSGYSFDFNDFVFDEHRDYLSHVTQRSKYFNVANRKPDPPWNVSPSNGQTRLPLKPTLTGSTFSDQDAASTHAASQWQVRTEGGSYGSPVYDSGEDAGNLTTITLSSGILGLGRYYWHVRYKDNNDKWSDYSDETWFETSQSTNILPILMLLLLE